MRDHGEAVAALALIRDSARDLTKIAKGVRDQRWLADEPIGITYGANMAVVLDVLPRLREAARMATKLLGDHGAPTEAADGQMSLLEGA